MKLKSKIASFWDMGSLQKKGKWKDLTPFHLQQSVTSVKWISEFKRDHQKVQLSSLCAFTWTDCTEIKERAFLHSSSGFFSSVCPWDKMIYLSSFRYRAFYSAKKPCCLAEVKIKPCLTCVILHWSACCHCHQIFLSFIFILDIMHFWKCVHKSSTNKSGACLFNCHQWLVIWYVVIWLLRHSGKLHCF